MRSKIGDNVEASDPIDDATLGDAVRRCASCGLFVADLLRLYARVQNELAGEAGSTCRSCGDCCDFGRREHRLFLSAGELALLTTVAPPVSSGDGRCPYQSGALCLARERRTLGCRTFFCTGPELQRQAMHERHHNEIRRLHDEHGLPYRYVELLAGLAEMGVAGV